MVTDQSRLQFTVFGNQFCLFPISTCPLHLNMAEHWFKQLVPKCLDLDNQQKYFNQWNAWILSASKKKKWLDWWPQLSQGQALVRVLCVSGSAYLYSSISLAVEQNWSAEILPAHSYGLYGSDLLQTTCYRVCTNLFWTLYILCSHPVFGTLCLQLFI